MPHATSPAPAARRRRAGPALMGLVAAAALSIAACGSSSDGAGAGPSTTETAPTTTAASAPTTAAAPGTAGPTVVKDILGTEVDPPGADGRTLSLVRYTIPAGAQLAPHIHPGVQMARITEGELTYTVVEGTAIVRRAGAAQDEELVAPATTTLAAGDTVTERDGMVHYGANDTDDDVIIDATLLTRDDEDLAVPVTTPDPPATTPT